MKKYQIRFHSPIGQGLVYCYDVILKKYIKYDNYSTTVFETTPQIGRAHV